METHRLSASRSSTYHSMDKGDSPQVDIPIQKDIINDVNPLQSLSPESETNHILLQSEAFQCYGNPASVTVKAHAVTIVSGGETMIFSFSDMIGVLLQGSTLALHSYPEIPSSCVGKPERQHKFIHLISKDADIANKWHDKLTRILNGEKYQQRKILVILNPVSGTRTALSHWRDVEPMFKQSGAFYEMIHTTHAGHAYEITNGLELSKYDSVVCISGDGLLSEAVNGLMNRPDWQVAVRAIRFGVIGAGTGNGLAKSISHSNDQEYSPLNSTFLVLKGRQRYLDTICVIQPETRPFFGFLSFAWGVISDVDIESEAYRWFGSARFTIAAVARIISLRRYPGVLSILKAENVEVQAKGHARGFPKYHICKEAQGSCQTCIEHDENTRVDELAAYLEHVRPFTGTSETWNHQDSKQEQPVTFPTAVSGSEKWEDIHDDWVSVWGMNITHAGLDLFSAPIAHFSDGYMDLLMMGHEITRYGLLSMFLDVEKGTHTSNKQLQYAKVKAFRLTPMATRHSPMAVDGEQIKYAPCEVRMFRGVLQILC